MPILEDIMDHEIIGRERRRGMEIGREEGREQLREEGQRGLILGMIEERFGSVPAALRARIEAVRGPELSNLGRRLVKAESLADLLN
jgi:predicted transposase YdaD